MAFSMPHRPAPAEIYQPFVISLYTSRLMLHIGMVSHVLTAIVIYFKLGDPFYLLCAGLIIFIWACRMLHMRGFDLDENIPRERAEIAYWEYSYIVGAGAVTLTLGVMCGYSLFVSRDPFAEMAAVSVTLATLISAVGHNFGSPRTVDVISVAACGPILIGLLLTQDIYMIILASLIVPYVIAIRMMARRVREFLLESIEGRQETARIAERLDMALNNMSYGLFMLDADGRILVANQKAGQLLGVADLNILIGRPVMLLIRLAMSRQDISRSQANVIRRQLDLVFEKGEKRVLIRIRHELYLEVSAKKRSDQGMVLIFEDVTARIHAEQEIRQMAHFDALTGLANRSYFSELVAETLSTKKSDDPVACIAVDIDDFKDINDTIGHPAGDFLLRAVAERLSAIAANDMIISRFSGNEFVLLAHQYDATSDLHAMLDRMIAALTGFYFVDGTRVFASVSAGVVETQAGSFDFEAAYVHADLALRAAKRCRKSSWGAFSDALEQDHNRRQTLKQDLREAISNDGLSLFYQPMFTLDGSRIVACEALSRWNHAKLGPISPGVFISLAEEMGLIGQLTRQILLKACRDCRSWPDDVMVSVNFSVHDLHDPGIIQAVEYALSSSGLPAARLQIEMTESAFVEDEEGTKNVLLMFKDMGVSVALDDFGTGYSNLSYVNTLPLDKIKVDKSFVANIIEDERQFTLLSGIFIIARQLGFETVIEGVESTAQLEKLQASRTVDIVQGHIFGQPISQQAILDLILLINESEKTATALQPAAC